MHRTSRRKAAAIAAAIISVGIAALGFLHLRAGLFSPLSITVIAIAGQAPPAVTPTAGERRADGTVEVPVRLRLAGIGSGSTSFRRTVGLEPVVSATVRSSGRPDAVLNLQELIREEGGTLAGSVPVLNVEAGGVHAVFSIELCVHAGWRGPACAAADVEVDTVAPAVPVLRHAPMRASVDASEARIISAGSWWHIQSEPGTTLEASLVPCNGSPPATVQLKTDEQTTVPVRFESTQVKLPESVLGDYWLTVKARDAVGNESGALTLPEGECHQIRKRRCLQGNAILVSDAPPGAWIEEPLYVHFPSKPQLRTWGITYTFTGCPMRLGIDRDSAWQTREVSTVTCGSVDKPCQVSSDNYEKDGPGSSLLTYGGVDAFRKCSGHLHITEDNPMNIERELRGEICWWENRDEGRH